LRLKRAFSRPDMAAFVLFACLSIAAAVLLHRLRGRTGYGWLGCRRESVAV
jgi:hypothetical protein